MISLQKFKINQRKSETLIRSKQEEDFRIMKMSEIEEEIHQFCYETFLSSSLVLMHELSISVIKRILHFFFGAVLCSLVFSEEF